MCCSSDHFSLRVCQCGQKRRRVLRKPLVDDKLEEDLHSFRGARYLIDDTTTAAGAKKRQTQFAERMVMGPRLAAELRSLQAKIR